MVDKLVNQIQRELKEAQLSRDEIKLSTLRLVLSEIKNAQINKGQQDLSEAEVTAVIQREVKKRREAAAGFRQGGREESALKEEAEQKILESYLPAQMSTEELTKIVENSITEIGAKGIQDMGKVMGVVMGKVASRTDGATVSKIVKEKLG